MSMRDQTWREWARCASLPLWLFHGHEGESDASRRQRERDAARVCAACPVSSECLADALASPPGFLVGVRGGLPPDELRLERRRRLRRAGVWQQ